MRLLFAVLVVMATSCVPQYGSGETYQGSSYEPACNMTRERVLRMCNGDDISTYDVGDRRWIRCEDHYADTCIDIVEYVGENGCYTEYSRFHRCQ